MLTFSFTHLAIALFLVVFPDCPFVGAQEKNVWRLKRDVEERERQLTRAQRELAEARARVALAEGNRDMAITELRKVVTGFHGEVLWIREHANWFCDPRDQMTQAQWDLAGARVQLAEVEGDTSTLVAELKKIVGFHEEQLERVKRLEKMAAIKPEEKNAFQEALNKARERLAAAEKKLANDQKKPVNRK